MPPTDNSNGLFNYEQAQTNDDHDFGTDWLATAIKEIAKSYQTKYRASNGSAPIAINDASQPHGGDTPDHAGHETGLMFDLLLPKKGGDFGGITCDSDEYDRKAARAMLMAINNHPLFKLAYFNDNVLINEGLCNPAGGHDNHIHFQISPPVRRA
jgi:Penicillin-insensitive murein endopeptidase